MSQQRETRSRDEISLRKRPGNPQQKRERSSEKEKEKDKEREKDGEGGGGRGIRTRLSTGSIHMNGTMTIAVAREIENNLSLKERTLREYKAAQQASQEASTNTPVSASTRKRSIGTKEKETTPTSTRSASPEAVTSTPQPPPKRRKIGRNDGSGEDNRNDYFCWLCHKEGTVVCCELCPRVYHTRCLEVTDNLPKDWVCPECEKIMRAECVETRSKAMSMISLDTFCTLLKYALERMKHQGSEPFTIPVDLSAVPYYTDYIFNPMDMELLEKNIRKKMYGCTEAFLADAKWIQHNCIIFNGAQNKLTGSAKMIIKICKHEMNEIELCPDCYLSSCIRKNDDWFTEPCRTPHTLVWAKLKGYPFWPAKALREVDGQVDVRFFGAHDRSWVHTSQVFLLSKDIPTASKTKRGGFDLAMDELRIHIKKIKEKFGRYDYAPFRTPYDKKHAMQKLVNKRYKKDEFPPYKSEVKFPVKIAPKPVVTPIDGAVIISTATSPSKLKSSPSILRQNTPAVRHATAVRNKYNNMATSRKSVSDSPVKSTSSEGAEHAKDATKAKTEVLKIPRSVTNGSENGDVKSESNNLESIKSESNKEEVTKADQTPSNTKLDENKKLVSKINIVDKLRSKFSVLYKSDDEESNGSVVNDSRDSEHEGPSTDGGAKVVDSAKNSDDVTCKNSDDVTCKNSDDVTCKNSDDVTCKDVNNIVDQSKEDNLPEDQELSVKQNERNEISSEEKVEKAIVDGKSPSKTEYLAKLRQTIQSCKDKLGITHDEDLEKMEIEEESADDEIEEEEDEKTDDKSVDEDNSREESSERDAAEDNKKAEIEEKDVASEERTENSKKDEQDISGTKELSSETTNSDCGKVVTEKGCDEVQSEKPEKIRTEKQDISENHDPCVSNKFKSSESERTKSSCVSDITKSSEITNSDSAMETVDNSEAADSSEEMETVTSLCESTGLVLSVKVPKRTLNVKVPQTAQSEDKPQGTNESSIATTKGVEVDTDSQHTDGAKTKSDTDVTDTAPSPKKKRDEPRSDLEITEWESGRKSPIYDKSPVYNKKSNSSEDAPRPPSSSTTELSSQFFQTAVEKTLNPPTTTSPSMMKPPQPTKVPAKPTEDDVQVINDSYRNSEQTQNASNMTCLSSPTSTSSAAILVQDDEIEDRVTSGPSGSRSGKQDGQSNIPAGARNLVSKFSAKFTAVMQETFEEMCTEFVQSELQKPKERDTSYDAEISRLEWEQKQQLVELKHNFQLALAEMKSCWAAENLRIVSDLKATLTKEKDQAVNDTKKKQWCANCGKEAIFYCCWNTSYCDYPCQQAHWPTHMPNCMQTQNSSNENEGEKDNNQSKSSSNNTSPQGPSNQSNQSTAPSQPVGNHGPTRPDNQENVDDFRHRVRENFTNVLRQQHQGPHPPPPHPTPQGMPFLPPGANMPQHNFMPVQPGPRPEDMGGMTRYPIPPWTDQNMDAAFRAVIKEGMSVNKAAKVFKVPRHKLTERLGARTSTAPNMQALTGNQPLAGNHPVQFQYVGQPTTLMPPGVQHLNSQQQIQIQTVNVQNQPGSSPNNMVGQPQMMHQNSPVVYPIQPQQILPGSQMIISQSGQQVPPGMINSSMPFPRHRFQ